MMYLSDKCYPEAFTNVKAAFYRPAITQGLTGICYQVLNPELSIARTLASSSPSVIEVFSAFGPEPLR
jgi:hypothetical protein